MVKTIEQSEDPTFWYSPSSVVYLRLSDFWYWCHGILNVSAKDKEPEKRQENSRLNLQVFLKKKSNEWKLKQRLIAAFQIRFEREKIDKINQADSLVFQTEKQVEGLRFDKLSEGKVNRNESATCNFESCTSANQKYGRYDAEWHGLNKAWEAAHPKMYKLCWCRKGAQSWTYANAGI